MTERNQEFVCYDDDGNTLPTLAKKGGVKRVIGRNISDVSCYLGSYGMGGPGFFGFKLAKEGRYPSEWLVLTLWSADNWLLLNNKWLRCHPHFFVNGKCFFHESGEYFSDISKRVYNYFFGLTIEKFFLRNRSFKMVMDSTVLELPYNLSLLPPHGDGSLRKWNTSDKIENRFIISPSKFIKI